MSQLTQLAALMMHNEEIYGKTSVIVVPNNVDLTKVHQTKHSCTTVHPTKSLKYFICTCIVCGQIVSKVVIGQV